MTTANDPRRVLITGTSSGFGHGAAQALAARGHTVYATMRGVDGKNREQAQTLRNFAEQGGHALHVLELDVTNDTSVQSGVGRALELGGGIDTVINNAGVGCYGLYEAYTSEQLAQAFDVNVVGAQRVLRAVLPAMREARSGQLLFLGSVLGRLMVPFMGPYTATKFAIEGMAESLAFELAPLGIDVTILQPGGNATDIMAKAIQPADYGRIEQYGPVKDMLMGFFKAYQEAAAAGHIGDPRRVVEAIVRVVELPKGERPLRIALDEQLGPPTEAINQTCSQVQQGILAAMGFGKQ